MSRSIAAFLFALVVPLWLAAQQAPEPRFNDLVLTKPLSPEDFVLLAQMGNGIRGAIEALPRPLRMVAEMRFVQELEYDVIAERMSITEANARKRVQQARELLRPRLKHLADLSLGVKDQEVGIAGAQTD